MSNEYVWEDYMCEEWSQFCISLSDSLFLPAVANRALSITHVRMPIASVKDRIITERKSRAGDRVYYHRYRYPYFRGSSLFMASHNDDDKTGRCFWHPNDSLKLWLGKRPPSELTLDTEPYPTDLDLPKQYFAHQYSTIISKSPLVDYFEMHGNWCLRRIQQKGPKFCRVTPNGTWTDTRGFFEITEEWFLEMWGGSIDSKDNAG